jgi:nanoRNase/pAp phosphatase (c-di-AMP/oligoRNAs hydrolase)
VVTRTPPPPARADLFDAQPGTTAGVATPATSPARSFFEQASIVVRTLPPLDQVLADAQVAPLDPATIPVPEDVLRTLEKAKRVLVVSHTPPDGDALGSCLGLRRALEALGKTADVCIDDDLPGSIRSLAQPGEVKRAAALAGQTYDAVVLVDIAIHKRVGGARALLEQTRNIVVLDHHHRDPLPSGFNLQPGVTIQNWVEPSADAACLMASAVCAHLATRAGHVVGQGPFAGVETPLIAGTLTDTQDFQVSGLEMESMRVLKHLVGAPGIVDIADVRAKLTYQLPACARGLLAVPPRYQGALATAAGADIVRRFEALPPEQRLRVETTAGTALLTCPRAVIDLAVEAARLEAPETTPNDVTGELQDQLDGLARTHDAAVLLYGARETVKASFRSKPVGLALQMARALGGGGHDCAAGATVESGLVGDVATTTRKLLREYDLKRDAQVRVGH